MRKDTPIYKYYEVKGDKVNRLRRECPRCGRGTFLAEHKDRLTCGKCGYTSYKKSQQH
ncbi:MAG: 30S ribosomal protein S27ae [Nitrososphaerales archaeon]